VPKDPGSPTDPGSNQGFERFTPRAKNVVMAAHQAAVEAGNAEIELAHLVLGLVSEPDGIAARAIESTGVSLDAVQQAAQGALPPAIDDAPRLVPYGAEARKALQLTFREALRLGHNYIGTEHLLLALLGTEPADGVLRGLGVERKPIEQRIAAALTV
jgi:ATP-dependent Clp protease ATP-binding subunit ClpA